MFLYCFGAKLNGQKSARGFSQKCRPLGVPRVRPWQRRWRQHDLDVLLSIHGSNACIRSPATLPLSSSPNFFLVRTGKPRSSSNPRNDRRLRSPIQATVVLASTRGLARWNCLAVLVVYVQGCIEGSYDEPVPRLPLLRLRRTSPMNRRQFTPPLRRWLILMHRG